MTQNHVKYCFIADMELLETLRKRTSVAQSWLIAQRAESNFDSFAQFCDKYNQGFCPPPTKYLVILDFLGHSSSQLDIEPRDQFEQLCTIL